MGSQVPISLRKKDHSASLEPQISGQIIKQENVTPPHDKKPRKHVVLKDAQPISPREKDQGASLEPQPSGGKVKQDNGQRTVKHSHTAKPRKPGKVGNTNPLLVHKQQQEWLKEKKRENLNRKLPEHGHRGVEHVKPPTPSTYTTLEINPKTKTQTKEMTSTTLTTSQGRDQEDQLTSAASGTSSSPRTSTVHSTAPFPRQNTRRRQPSTEKGEKTSPTKSSQEAAVRRPDNKPASTGPSTPPSVLTREKYSSPVHTATPSTTSLLSRHLEIVRAIEAADVAQKATEPVTTQSVLTTVPTKRSNLQRKGSTKRHQTAEVSTTTPHSSRRQSPAFPTKQTRGTELKTTISTYETESDRTDLFVSTETSTTPFTTTRQPDNENEEPDTSSTRAESMKRVKTQTFQTPTEVMWYVTTHPAYVKTNPRFVTHYSDVEIRRKDDTTSPTEHLPPRQSGEQKYHIPKDIKSPFEQPEIRVQKVRTQEKNEQKKRRRFRPLKSRLDLVPSLTYPTNTDVLTPASLKPTDERRHQFQQSPFSSPETQLIKTQEESATTSHSLTTKTHDLSSNKESHGTKSPDTQFRKSPFEAPQRNKTPETVVQSTTGAFTTSSCRC
ncbi:hypothetical protein BaRGS_00030342 [Batillaria attramentaria]|uniref:Uncharacterized protein n=1 Tax=Batillaria attramentaria TaxID=370345 RepID=A0ABD0JTR3_9CAEN